MAKKPPAVKNKDKALDDLERALDLDKKAANAGIRYWLGKVYLYRAVTGVAKNPAGATSDFVEAEKYFERAAELARSQRLPEARS